MRKYLLIGFLILTFSLVGFVQTTPELKVEDFVLTKIEPSKTVIFVGDRFELGLEILYPKDWGIQILTEDLEKNSMAAMLPESIILEKAEIFQPIPWGDYWLKVKAVYSLFYPEKKHDFRIQFNPAKIRFKLADKDIKEARQGIEVYEIETQGFYLGIRSLLTPSSNAPRDSKTFSGNFLLKYRVGYIIGSVFILFGLFIPLRAAIQYFQRKRRGVKELSIRGFLESELQKLNSQISDDEFRRILRNVIGKMTGFNVLALTSSEIKEKIAGKDSGVITLASILEKYDELGYNTKAKSVSKPESIEAAKKVISGWIPDRWHQKLFKRIKRWRN